MLLFIVYGPFLGPVVQAGLVLTWIKIEPAVLIYVLIYSVRLFISKVHKIKVLAY
jgi:hypothetical protein